MEVEHIIRSFIVDENLQKQVQELEAQGYQIIPGIPPVIVYHLARPKQPPVEQGHSALGKMLINEDLISVLGPDGKRRQ